MEVRLLSQADLSQQIIVDCSLHHTPPNPSANVVNVKNAIHHAHGVRVVVVLNFYSLKADRARGLNDLAKILVDLFGNAQGVEQCLKSMLLCVSQVKSQLHASAISLGVMLTSINWNPHRALISSTLW